MKKIERNGKIPMMLLWVLSLLAAPAAWAQGLEAEPNHPCTQAQNLGAVALPYTLNGSLDTPPSIPDIDFYRLSATPGDLLTVVLGGTQTGQGTLNRPQLTIFGEDCVSFLAYGSFDGGSAQFLVPASGNFVVAASSYWDFGYQGTGGSAGTYVLNVIKQPVAESVSGRLIDAQTGAPVANAFLSLLRCDQYGSCYDGVGSVQTQADGTFLFEHGASSTYAPLLPGNYILYISPATPDYNPLQFGPFQVLADLANDLGEIQLTPIPAVNSITVRLVDEITGQPLPGNALPFAHAQLNVCPYPQFPSYCFSLRQANPDGNGIVRFEGKPGWPLEAGTYEISAGAQQYENATSGPFTLGATQHLDLGDFGVRSFPVRFYTNQACGPLPQTGGRCDYSVTVVNGTSSLLRGQVWSIVGANGLTSGSATTVFQAGSPKGLELAPGQSAVQAFGFNVPGTVANGASICTFALVANKPYEFDLVGQSSLFCVRKGLDGFSVVPEAQERDAVEASQGKAGR